MKNWKRYFIVFLLFFLLIAVQVRNPNITGPFKGVAGNMLNPFVYIVNRAGISVANIWNKYIWLVGVVEENGYLKEHVDALSLEYAILSEKLMQLENLNKLLDFKDTYGFTTTAANVISRNVDGYMKYIIIDRGSKDGINVNDPVVSASGLVGRVSDVYRGTSRVVLLHHHDSNVSVINSRTRAVGILKGDGKGGLYVDYYDRLDLVENGDGLITSGMGQLFPKGIRVGFVKSIEASPTGLFQLLEVEGAIDYYKLEQVLVVNHDKQFINE